MSDREFIDARKSQCPGPLMELVAAIKVAKVGDEVEVLSSNEGTLAQVTAWTKKSGHQLLSSEKRGDHWSFVVKKMK